MIRSHFKLYSALLGFLILSCSCCSILNPEPKHSPILFYPPSANGPYQYRIVIDSVFPSYMIDVEKLSIRIPLIDSKKTLPTIIIESGYFSTSTDLEDVEKRYASHGFLVVGVTNTSHYNLITTSLNPYKLALLQTVKYAVECTKDSTSKLFGMIDSNAIGISGHSMGGGGTILSCDSVQFEYNHYIKTAIAMNPFGRCSGRNIRIPIFLISSDLDAVVNPFMPGVSSSPQDIYFSFQTVPMGNTKLFTNFKDMDHNAVVDRNIFLNTSGNANVFLPSMVSWFKVFLAQDSSYCEYIDTTGNEFKLMQYRFVSNGSVPGYLYNK